ncbi:hypothetical protein POTOM_034568 [Populus tomentosa]|uniref:Partial AB-hydrolase lipase domain-containing protein n=1 Tax=Populus tomentosa TaxID=118781 RepID=A0A8X7YYX0_POPTO|nr:hypothetical protein POTOM_034568 [Populus tomentosa]
MERLLLIVFAIIISLFISTSAAGEFNFEANLHRRSPDETMCNQLIKPAGYSCTEHTVQTKDGYLVALQRLSSRNKDLGGQMGPPVLLQHGLFMAGDAWFLGSPEQSLGFILADEGFDVWVGNVRGTFWSHGHISLSEKDKVESIEYAFLPGFMILVTLWIVVLVAKSLSTDAKSIKHRLLFQEFWDWSWEELALFDLAEMIHYVHSVTSSKVFIVGHSQGTIMSLAALIQPNVVEMVEAAALLCPISYLDHLTAPLVLRIVALHLDQMVLAMGIHQLNFRSKILIDLLDSICDGHIECADLLTSITGKNCCFNSSSVDFFFEFEPHPSSAKNLRHLFQSMPCASSLAVIYEVHVNTFLIRKGTFSHYDYGMFKNLELYGQLNPPAFDLGLIPKTLPLWMGYGGRDSLADETDLERTLKELQGKPELLYLENYGHLDFLLSTQGKEDVYNNMIAFFRSLGKSSSS